MPPVTETNLTHSSAFVSSVSDNLNMAVINEDSDGPNSPLGNLGMVSPARHHTDATPLATKKNTIQNYDFLPIKKLESGSSEASWVGSE